MSNQVNHYVVKTCSCGGKFVCNATPPCISMNKKTCSRNCFLCKPNTQEVNCRIKMVSEKKRKGNPQFIGGHAVIQ